jgi:hypothetical protein
MKSSKRRIFYADILRKDAVGRAAVAARERDRPRTFALRKFFTAARSR